jgi:tetratricopeptide (TPR) repeat protein
MQDVNDEVLKTLLRIAPDLESWATSVEFKFTTDELLDFLRQRTDELFAGEAIPKLENCFELEAACHDLQRRGQKLEPDLEASLEFVRGLEDFARDKIDEALEHYQKSLAFWQQGNHLERQGILLLNIALCYNRKAELNRAESRHCWENSRRCLQQCLDVFEQDSLEGHTNWVRDVSFSPDGKMIASVGDDNTIKLWSVNRALPNTLTGHSGIVTSTVISADGHIIASASADHTIKL